MKPVVLDKDATLLSYLPEEDTYIIKIFLLEYPHIVDLSKTYLHCELYF